MLNARFVVDFPLTIEMNSAEAVCVVGMGAWTIRGSVSSHAAGIVDRSVLTIQMRGTPIGGRGRSRVTGRALSISARTNRWTCRSTRTPQTPPWSGGTTPRNAAAEPGAWSCGHARSRRSMAAELEQEVTIIVENGTGERVRVHERVVVLPGALESTDLLHQLVEVYLLGECLFEHVHRVPELCRSALRELRSRKGGIMGTQGVNFDTAVPTRPSHHDHHHGQPSHGRL